MVRQRIDACDPCDCIEGNIPWETFKQEFLVVACQILNKIQVQAGGPITPCEPCNCTPGYVSDDYFKQATLVVFCQILGALP